MTETLKFERDSQEAKKITDMLSDYVNHMKSNKAFIEAFKVEHRALQQSMFRLFLELMEEMATHEYKTDGRNEQSKKIAEELLEGFKLIKEREFLQEGVSEERAKSYLSICKPSGYLRCI